MTPANPELRQFITQFFNDEELDTLCFDYFPEAFKDFSSGMSNSRKVSALIGYCERRDRLADLHAAVARERPEAWNRQFNTQPIETSPPLPRDPRQIFLSHATADAEFAHHLAGDLRAEGWRVWIAPESIRPGEKWVEAIDRGLETSGVYLVVLTPAAVASRWVNTETDAAVEMQHEGLITFIPLDVVACQPKRLWRQYQYVSFRGSYQVGLDSLLNRLDITFNGDEYANWLDSRPYKIFPGKITQGPPVRQVKLVLLGEGKTGKTSIVERLVHDKPPTDKGKTEGVEISTWMIELKNKELNKHNTTTQVRVRIWDFGGQDIYHATHQFFLTKRTLYLIVLDARQGEYEGRLDYWLRLVENLSGKSPIIVVVNKVDQHTLNLDKRGIINAYPSVQDVLLTSCISGYGIEELRIKIFEILGEMPHIFDELSPSWRNVQAQLETISENYITYEKYSAICEENGVKESERENLLSLLHDLGVVLCFSDDSRLVGSPVLNPEWVTKGVYNMLSSQDIQDSRGLFRMNQLSAILDAKQYPRNMHPFLVDLMRRFDLCFPLPSSEGSYLVPDLFPKEEPSLEIIESGGLELYYDYSQLSLSPSVVVCRLMARLYQLISQQQYWRNGVVFERENNKALVKVDRANRRLTIRVTGLGYTRRNLMAIIREQLNSIHNESTGFSRPTEFVPFPDDPEKAIPYNVLRNLEARKIRVWTDPYNQNKEVDVRRLLEGIEPMSESDLSKIQEKLNQAFSIGELEQLIFEFGIPDGEFEHTTNKDKFSRELLLYLQRRGEVARFVAMCRTKRTNMDW